MKKNEKQLVVASILIIILISGCAESHAIHLNGEPSGFWSGLWHGFISAFTFIGSLIWDDVAIYDINNTGGWYDFGFLLGVGGLGFSSRNNRS